MAGKFEIKKSTKGQFFFNLKKTNSEVVLTSKQYDAKAAAENGIEQVKANASFDSLYERKKSSAGEPYFILKASNGSPLALSKMYYSFADMESGIDSVKKEAPKAQVEDASSVGSV